MAEASVPSFSELARLAGVSRQTIANSRCSMTSSQMRSRAIIRRLHEASPEELAEIEIILKIRK